jgi:hypothetical protein
MDYSYSVKSGSSWFLIDPFLITKYENLEWIRLSSLGNLGKTSLGNLSQLCSNLHHFLGSFAIGQTY